MSYEQKITELEGKVNLLYNIIHSLVSPVYIEELRCLREECEQRFTKLEERFDAANASSKESVLNVCKMQEAVMKDMNKAREFFEQVDNITENRDYISFCDTVEHKNIFRIIDRSVREISLGSLLGLIEIMREYDSTSLFECFKDYNKLIRIDFPINFITDNVTDMTAMFHGCSGLNSLDLSIFDTSRVTDMSSMFEGCSSLSSLNLSSFNTSNVTCMSGIFSGCSSLSSLNLSSFNTSNVTSMSCMFHGCSSLMSLDLSTFNTSNVTSMNSMFSGCHNLYSLECKDPHILSALKGQCIDSRV